MRQLLLDHLKKYPLMQLQDCIKLLYQSRFGCGHFLSDPAQVMMRLQNEYRDCIFSEGPLFRVAGFRLLQAVPVRAGHFQAFAGNAWKSFYLLFPTACFR